MLGFKFFCTCWSLVEVTTHDRPKETKTGNLNEIGGKESWTTGLSVETVLMEPFPTEVQLCKIKSFGQRG
ncbi:hypothetical protein EMCRGX_G013590 [Ephydatia muelleri]